VPQHDRQRGRRDKRDQEAGMGAELWNLPQPRGGGQLGRLQEAGAELPQRSGQHLLHQQQRDEV
jgi:hypothetical protein